ncbi:MAG: DUF5011 domain-containing protein, partial [Firmicutes bacterium]|nr:DUF5011 domain-containing protein [Bacillota bacterium]
HPVVIENDVDTSLVGIYTIIYQITYLEYEKTITRIVTVIDETPPNINLNPGVDTIVVGQAWIDAGVTAIDNSNLEVIITVTSYVIIEQPGEYQVIYQATDESGNSATIIRYVNIIELT